MKRKLLKYIRLRIRSILRSLTSYWHEFRNSGGKELALRLLWKLSARNSYHLLVYKSNFQWFGGVIFLSGRFQRAFPKSHRWFRPVISNLNSVAKLLKTRIHRCSSCTCIQSFFLVPAVSNYPIWWKYSTLQVKFWPPKAIESRELSDGNRKWKMMVIWMFTLDGTKSFYGYIKRLSLFSGGIWLFIFYILHFLDMFSRRTFAWDHPSQNML